MKTFIVIPAFNEEENIFSVIDGLKIFFHNIVVVDDGSTDKTGEIAKKNKVFFLNHIVNRGQGAALKTGTDFALSKGAEIIVHFDADGQHQARDVFKLIQPIEKRKADIVLGSRFLENQCQIPWTKRFFLLYPARIFTRFITGIRLSDAHNGLRAFNRKAAQLIDITQERMAHNSEIYSEVMRHKLNYTEVPVSVLYKEYGQGLQGGAEILFDLFKKKFFKL